MIDGLSLSELDDLFGWVGPSLIGKDPERWADALVWLFKHRAKPVAHQLLWKTLSKLVGEGRGLGPELGRWYVEAAHGKGKPRKPRRGAADRWLAVALVEWHRAQGETLDGAIEAAAVNLDAKPETIRSIWSRCRR